MENAEKKLFSLSSALEESGQDYTVLYKLAAIGVNAAMNSYRDDKEVLSSAFLSLPKEAVLMMWQELEDRPKLSFINKNDELILEWLRNG